MNEEKPIEKPTEERLAKLEKRFDSYMVTEEDHYFEFSSLRNDFKEFERNFHFVMSSKRTWFGRLIMWMMFKGDIKDAVYEQSVNKEPMS